jgi:RND family efflux transporter MFP subunit
VVLLALGACAAPERETKPDADEPALVRLATAERRPLPELGWATGSLEALRRATPGSKILGRVEAAPVREGQPVRSGALLARLESGDLRAALAQAEAMVDMAEANLENARSQRERIAGLEERGSATAKELEDAETALRVADATLAQSRARRDAADVVLGYAEIRSPLAGWVTERRIEVGDMVTPGVPLFVVEDSSRLEVSVVVPEAEVVGLEPTQRARVVVLDETLEAQIDRIVPAGDPTSRTFEVRLVLDNEDGRFRSGMFARVAFSGAMRQTLAVDAGALVSRGQLDGVFVAGDDGVLRLRWLELGRKMDDWVEVLAGLEESERYVVAPDSSLRDGVPYREDASS